VVFLGCGGFLMSKVPCRLDMTSLCALLRHSLGGGAHRGTSLVRNCLLLGPYRRALYPGPMVILGGGGFLISEVPCRLHMTSHGALQGYLAHPPRTFLEP